LKVLGLVFTNNKKDMKIEQHYEKCLSQASYYIENEGLAIVIDPLRDIDQYLLLAERDQAKIKYIFETHFHADFVSGHLELASRTGAKIIFGPEAVTAFESYVAADQEVFDLNGASITVLHTPGHTLESSCFLLKDEQGVPNAIFTGDTLFLGDVGRPDLAQDMDIKLSTEDLAGMLYDSLRSKILPLPDHTVIYPGHGAGSACGKNMSSDRSGTLKTQKLTNYALAEDLSRIDFILQLCDKLPAPPPYFPMNVKMNIKGYESMDSVVAKGNVALDPESFNNMMDTETLVLDTRSAELFAKMHIPGSINIGLDGSFAPWVGAIIPVNQQRILLICEKGREKEALVRLGRIGYHQGAGFLLEGIEAWKNNGFDTDNIKCITADDCILADSNRTNIVDVRNELEFAAGNVFGSINIPLSNNSSIQDHFRTELDYMVYCQGGYRSMIFISLLKKKGFHRLINVNGGYGAISKLANQK
jgi:hydroxyacylglutathione hydrolase